ncbi:MAG: MFS transporter [Novosphingobium sp.]|nr:MFS transporter [Novosphingobium sp.]
MQRQAGQSTRGLANALHYRLASREKSGETGRRTATGRETLSYFGEFKAHWHQLLGASLGIAFGAALNHYMTNLFGPALIAEFGWSKADFALVGVMPLATMLVIPFQGRFTDRVGVRMAASVGVVVLPITFIAFSMMSGNILHFFTIMFLQALVGMLVGTLTYTRVLVEKFDAARGMALSLGMTMAPLAGAVMTPVMGNVIDEYGWRTGYQVMALLTGAGGAIALMLIGKTTPASRSGREAASDGSHALTGRSAIADLKVLIRQPAFLLLVAGMLFCNFPQVLVGSQLKLVVMESGAPAALATWIVSLYATGVIVGRFACGIALDKVAAHKVAIVGLGLPAVGFLALASPYDAPWILGGAILLVGLAQGAEGDIGAYLVSRNFDLGLYSFVFAFISCAMFLASATGSVVLSRTLAWTDSFDTFLVIAAVLTVLGALAFYLTGWTRTAHPEAHEPAVAPAGPVQVLVGDEI